MKSFRKRPHGHLTFYQSLFLFYLCLTLNPLNPLPIHLIMLESGTQMSPRHKQKAWPSILAALSDQQRPHPPSITFS
jgi:hypothetical protein